MFLERKEKVAKIHHQYPAQVTLATILEQRN